VGWLGGGSSSDEESGEKRVTVAFIEARPPLSVKKGTRTMSNISFLMYMEIHVLCLLREEKKICKSRQAQVANTCGLETRHLLIFSFANEKSILINPDTCHGGQL
jgi:hypothetical protein